VVAPHEGLPCRSRTAFKDGFHLAIRPEVEIHPPRTDDHRTDNCAFGADDVVRILELVRKIGSDIDLVISDIKMPKLDGIQLANLVRAEFPKIPIILVSGLCRCGP
jgi:CheY-like chemotaxis protein